MALLCPVSTTASILSALAAIQLKKQARNEEGRATDVVASTITSTECGGEEVSPHPGWGGDEVIRVDENGFHLLMGRHPPLSASKRGAGASLAWLLMIQCTTPLRSSLYGDISTRSVVISTRAGDSLARADDGSTHSEDVLTLKELIRTITRLLNETAEAHNHMLVCALWGIVRTHGTGELVEFMVGCGVVDCLLAGLARLIEQTGKLSPKRGVEEHSCAVHCLLTSIHG